MSRMIDEQYYTPSPSSSPSLTPVDSSPPSSPGLAAISTPPASPGPKDPFAGSSKSNKRPRIYERHDSKRTTGEIRPFLPEPCTYGEDPDASRQILGADDATPTRVVDLFSGSAKRAWRPPTYEKKQGRVTSTGSAVSSSSSASYAYGTRRGASPTPTGKRVATTLHDTDDDFVLSDDEWDKPQPAPSRETKAELELRLWDETIATAIDKQNGIIDLSGTSLNKGPITHIPPTIADLESYVVLPPTQNSSSVPSSPKASPTLLPTAPETTFSSARPFIRATTLPAAAFNDAFFLRSKDGERLRGTPAARAASLQSVAQPNSTQLRRREIHMFLANNSIPRLPVELFRVSSLTVLSLRSNALTSVPPQIAQLTSLQELNLAQNKLRWLPAEMLSMRLTKLTVAGNPWIPPPLEDDSTRQPSQQASPQRQRPVSFTTIHYTIPPLVESCLRILLAPHNPDSSHSSPRPLTVLEASYALPLTEDLSIGPSVLATLRACVPAAVARPATAAQLAGPSKVKRDEGQRDVHSSLDDDVFGGGQLTGSKTRRARSSSPRAAAALDGSDHDPPAISICPSPLHQGQTRVPVFVQPAEERWTWEEVIAGVRVGAEGVGRAGVPVRWRGCKRGCLAFLDPETEAASQPVSSLAQEVDSQGGVLSTLVDADEDVLMDETFSEDDGLGLDLQEVSFEGGLADPEDFEDGF
ncbi:hypothetical protein ONZ51_g12819 [Trametes cubensis]|uniref:Uncharacterized protein n=1 Tax=Trametes cubensis TaxID=1111947 RepID=A0AAD7TF38_9APHY|nr:hypothetical protein ONZ51_g12819 [Trametes cubensis]